MSLSGDIPVPPYHRCGSRRWGPRRQARFGRLGFSNIDKAKNRDRLKQSPARSADRVQPAADASVPAACSRSERAAAPIENGSGDVRGEIAEADKPREIGGADAFLLGQCGKRHAVASGESGIEAGAPGSAA